MKPYGYVWTSIKDCMETRFTRLYPNEFYKPFDIVPVYTRPVKELTDEKKALKSLYDAVIRYENLSPFADTYAVESCEFQLHDAKEKAKAILRKAQEK
jgi:hypothetical protein